MYKCDLCKSRTCKHKEATSFELLCDGLRIQECIFLRLTFSASGQNLLKLMTGLGHRCKELSHSGCCGSLAS